MEKFHFLHAALQSFSTDCTRILNEGTPPSQEQRKENSTTSRSYARKMNVNKKLDRFKQWAGERMGGEVKTNVSDDFKSLEVEMTLRHEGQHSNRESLSSLLLTTSRHGAPSEIHDCLRQDPFEAKRRRR